VQLGYISMNTADDTPVDAIARELQDRGYESLWIGEHPHIPVSRKTPYPAGGDLPDQYRRIMDPFLSLAIAAGASTTLRLGTGVALALEHDVFDLAKRVSTLDVLSGGRFLFGVGVGWNHEELANCRSLPWSQRYQALAENIGALQALWCQDEAEFHGKHFDFEPVWSEPKPVQRPHPPILCGMAGKLGTKHTLQWADEWMPLDIGLGNVAHKLGLFRSATAAAGRNDIPVTIVAWGDPTLEILRAYCELGVKRIIVGLSRANGDDPATTLPFLDRYAEMLPRLV
jgi:probable F420-dependent oxidoreductase